MLRMIVNFKRLYVTRVNFCVRIHLWQHSSSNDCTWLILIFPAEKASHNQEVSVLEFTTAFGSLI